MRRDCSTDCIKIIMSMILIFQLSANEVLKGQKIASVLQIMKLNEDN